MIIFWILTNRLVATYEEKLILWIVCTRFFFDTHGLDFKKHAGESCRNSNQLFSYLNLGIIQFEALVLKAWNPRISCPIQKRLMRLNAQECSRPLSTCSWELCPGSSHHTTILHRISKSIFCKTTNHHHLQHERRTHHLSQHLANHITDIACALANILFHTQLKVPLAEVPLLNTPMRREADI